MRLILLIILFLNFHIGYSQIDYIIVNQDSISVQEFKESYQNNIEIEGLASAIETYIDFKLLQQAAHRLEVDSMRAFHRIFEESIRPEREKYLYRPEIEHKLKSEIWQNLQTDRQAEIYAIGIQNPFDKQNVAEKEKLVQDLYQHICENKKVSEKSISYLENNPILKSWVRPFSVSAEIERVIYQTPIGQCSEIHASERGNFFVKVLQERPSSGFVTFDFIYNQDKNKLVEAQNALQNQKDWTKVKTQYHQPTSGKANTDYVKLGESISEDFLHAIQSLKDESITDIVESDQGYYLIQVYRQEKFDEFKNWETWMEERILHSSYVLDYIEALENRALEVIQIQEDQNAIEEVLVAVGNDFYKDKTMKSLDLNKPIWMYGNQSFGQNDLLYELNNSKQFYHENSDFRQVVNDIIPKLKKQFILNHYLSDLEKHEIEFAKSANLIRESIKINHLIEFEINAKAEKDTLGMQKFLNQNIEKFTWPKRYDLDIYRYRNAEDAEVIIRALNRKKSSDEIMKEFEGKTDEKGALRVVYTNAKIPLDHSDIPSDFHPKKKIQNIHFKNTPAIIKLNAVLKSQPMSLEEAINPLKEMYKVYQYEQMLKNLREASNIFVPQTLSYIEQ